MDSFCGSPFWDWDLTWNNTNPRFTDCFQNTVLNWVPVVFLVLFTPVDIFLSTSNKNDVHIPWTSLTISKLGLTSLLMCCKLVRLFIVLNSIPSFPLKEILIIYPVEYVAPIVSICGLTLYLALFLLSVSKGVGTSGVHFFFWFFLACCEFVRFEELIFVTFDKDSLIKLNMVLYITELIYFPITCGMFILHCWSEYGQRKGKKSINICPEDSSSFPSRILFHWYNTLAWTGYKRPIEFSNLWELQDCNQSETIIKKFQKYWDLEIEKKYKKIIRKAGPSLPKVISPAQKYLMFAKELNPNCNILPVIFKCFGGTFLFGSLLKIIPDLLAFVSPLLLNSLINFVESDEPTWKGLLYAVLMFGSAFLQSLFTAQYSHRMYLTGMRIRTALTSAVYNKALRLSNAVKKESTIGEIVNLMSVDTQKLMDCLPFINLLWSAPFQIAISLYLLWQILGVASLAGVGIMILLIPVNAIVAAKVKQYQIIQMKNKDQRVKMMSEVLTGIKVLKFYAWEPSYHEQIVNVRGNELKTIEKAAYINAILNVTWGCLLFMVTLATFGTYVYIDENNKLDATTAFVSLALFNVMNVPMTYLAFIILQVVQAYVSINRLNKFMNSEEIDPFTVSHDPAEVDPIVIKNATFFWDRNLSPCLCNINLRVPKGSLVAVVGTVGSGKSSLLSAMLGELERSSGSVNTIGSIGYVSQQAWIQNKSLKENIIFGRSFEPIKYQKMIKSCALKPDIDMLPAGDQTEIGEKGINLSGGQKQRVALARACYMNADTYLLDDPLSAVDAHVGKHIFENVIGPSGILKRKTRILVTHGITYLPKANQIIVIKNGEISEIGAYKELIRNKGAFAEFLRQHLTGEDLIEIENDTDFTDVKEMIGDEVETIRKRIKSPNPMNDSDTDICSDSTLKALRDVGRSQDEDPEKQKLIEVEKSETKSVKFSVYLDYFRAAGWFWTLAVFILFTAHQGFSIAANLSLSAWSDAVTLLDSGGKLSDQNRYLLVYGLLGVGQMIAVLLGSVFLAKSTVNASSVLHNNMLNQVIRAPMSFFDTTPVGRLVNRFSKDIDITDSTIPFCFRFLIMSIFQVLSILIIISYSTPVFIAVILPILVLYYIVQAFYISTSRQLKRLESVSRSPIYSHFGETMAGSAIIRAFGEEERFMKESENKVDCNQMAYFPSVCANRWLAVRLETLGNSVVFFAALFAVLGRGEISAGLAGLSVSYALQITMSLIMLVRWSSDMETNIVAVERIKEYTEVPQEAPWTYGHSRVPYDWPAVGKVEFINYETKYRPQLDLVLKGIDFCVMPGEKVGIVGRTGAGKSSLTLALFRIIEAFSGMICIDGVNISKIGLHDLRKKLTIIPQDPVLFSGSLRMNLDPFNEQSDEKIWYALEISHLKQFVSTLSEGLDYMITEGGDNLSVGQRQLVCLSRALLRKTKILILDEATAAVDLDTDDLIQKTIRTEFQDCTVITIAHRINTILDCDRVLVLDKGRVREFEAPEKLIRIKDSLFYKMAKDAGMQLPS